MKSMHFDESCGFNLHFIEFFQTHSEYIIYRRAPGKVVLSIKENKEYNLKLCGHWLKYFHSLTYDKKQSTAFLFGDYGPYHIFIDHNEKNITAIDPGAGFGSIDEIEIDLARFIVSLLQTHSFNMFKIRTEINSFLEGYSGSYKISFDKLKKWAFFRIKRNYLKRKISKAYSRAIYWVVCSYVKFFLICYFFKISIPQEK